MSSPDIIHFKVALSQPNMPDQIRRFTIEKDLAESYDHLSRKLCTVFPILNSIEMNISWRDSDDDLVTISSDEELVIALAEMTGNCKKLHVNFVAPVAFQAPPSNPDHGKNQEELDAIGSDSEEHCEQDSFEPIPQEVLDELISILGTKLDLESHPEGVREVGPAAGGSTSAFVPHLSDPNSCTKKDVELIMQQMPDIVERLLVLKESGPKGSKLTATPEPPPCSQKQENSSERGDDMLCDAAEDEIGKETPSAKEGSGYSVKNIAEFVSEVLPVIVNALQIVRESRGRGPAPGPSNTRGGKPSNRRNRNSGKTKQTMDFGNVGKKGRQLPSVHKKPSQPPKPPGSSPAVKPTGTVCKSVKERYWQTIETVLPVLGVLSTVDPRLYFLGGCISTLQAGLNVFKK